MYRLRSCSIPEPYTPRNIYLAGPFFTSTQIETMSALYAFLRQKGYNVLSAFKNGVNLAIAYTTIQDNTTSTREASELVYYLNIAVGCFDLWSTLSFGDITVANVSPLNDNETPPTVNEDSGTVVELACSVCFNHPLVLWNDSLSRLIPQGSVYYNGFPNPMMSTTVNLWNLSPQNSQNLFHDYSTNSLSVLGEQLDMFQRDGVTSQKSGFPDPIGNEVQVGYHMSQILLPDFTTSSTENSQDYDLLVRLSTKTREIHQYYHIPSWNSYDFVQYWS